MAMSPSEILNIIFGGGLVALVVALFTMKATVRKANADAEKAKADAESVRITNTENATRILVENIVKPLKDELNATREDLQSTRDELQTTKKEVASSKRAMSRLAKAVEAISECSHADDCPVRHRLRDYPKGELGRGGGDPPGTDVRQYVGGHPPGYGGVRAREPGADGNTG